MLPTLFWIPTASAGRLATMAHPPGGAALPPTLAAIHSAGVDTLLILLTDAELQALELADAPQQAQAAGLTCLRFPIADFTTPPLDQATVRLLHTLAATIQAGRTLLIHCWAGVGRSSLIAAAVLVVLGVAPDSAFARISAARGRAVPDTAAQRAWVYDFAEKLQAGDFAASA